MKNKFISNLFWGSWSKDIHSIKEQKKIIYDLGNLDMIVDFNNKSAYLVNGKNIMIHTTLNKCTCDNFKKRRLPCEHIYYLASRLNLPFGLNGTTCDDFNYDYYEKYISDNFEELNNNYSKSKYIYYEDDENWGGWSVDIHRNNQQIMRFNRKCLNEKYNTTLSSCTCFDFTKRRLPCKHIYYLAYKNKLKRSSKKTRNNLNKDHLNIFLTEYFDNIRCDFYQIENVLYISRQNIVTIVRGKNADRQILSEDIKLLVDSILEKESVDKYTASEFVSLCTGGVKKSILYSFKAIEMIVLKLDFNDKEKFIKWLTVILKKHHFWTEDSHNKKDKKFFCLLKEFFK